MRTIIAGSRWLRSTALLAHAIRESGFTITTVLSGRCRGADRLGEAWAKRNGIPVELYPADWKTHGKAAGPIRNQIMAERADALVAVKFPRSRGTSDMVRRAHAAGLRVFVLELDENSRPIQPPV